MQIDKWLKKKGNGEKEITSQTLHFETNFTVFTTNSIQPLYVAYYLYNEDTDPPKRKSPENEIRFINENKQTISWEHYSFLYTYNKMLLIFLV